MRWIKSTKMNPPGLRRRAVLLCFLARSNWSSVGGWREIQNFFKRLICKRLFRWYMFQKQMTFFGLFRYQGSYLLKQPIITHFELVDPSRQVIYISQMYISLCLVALISHLCKLASWPNVQWSMALFYNVLRREYFLILTSFDSFRCPGGERSRDWAEAEIEKTRDSCDFCKPDQLTVDRQTLPETKLIDLTNYQNMHF